MTGAELVIRCLEQEGVRYVFGVPGEETLDLNEALRDSAVRFVSVRHEQGAAFMAEACGRFYTAVVQQRLTQDGDPRLARHLANATLKDTPAGGYIVKESRHSPKKIDLAVAG